MGANKSKNNKGFKVHQWNHQGRKQVMDCLQLNDGSIPFALLKSGCFTQISNDLRIHSKIQKNLRQFLYGQLVELGMDSSNYILNFKAPINQHSSKKDRYVQIDVMIPNVYGNEIEKNVEFFNRLIDKMILELKIINEKFVKTQGLLTFIK